MGRATNVILVAVLVLQVIGCLAWGGGGEKVRLEDVKVLTLKHGQMTTGRRSSPVTQLKCVGGSARCEFAPKVVQCYNKGSDGYSVQWECKTDMDNTYRFGDISVTCEGYDYPDDPYVLKGSCGLEYTIDLTKEGMHSAKHTENHQYYGGGGGGADYGWNPNVYKDSPSKNGFIANLACGAVVIVIVYAIYKTCISPATDERRQRSTTNDDYHGRGPGSAPPPPGFRSNYSSPGAGSGNDSGFADDSCGSSSRSSGATGSSTAGAGGFSRAAGGFWGGAAAGGLLGYMFGNRGNNNTYYGSGTTYRSRPSTGFGGGWGSGFSSGSSYSGSSSSGSRSASGFGGTTRR